MSAERDRQRRELALPVGTAGGGRRRYAAAMWLYREGEVAEEALELYRALALDDRADPAAELRREGLSPPPGLRSRGEAKPEDSGAGRGYGPVREPEGVEMAAVGREAGQREGRATMAELMAALPHVRAAPKTQAPILSLCFRPAFNRREFPQSLRLTREEGIPGDRWLTQPWLRLPDGRPDPRIQVSILPSRVLDLVWRDRDRVPHPGDTIVADLDTSVANLPEGTLLRAGSAVLRVSGLFNEGCAKWKVRYGAAARDWVVAPGHPDLRLRGVLCAVVEDGEVALSDRLVKLP